jgi:soluble lytic murein transglycosylase-like protein
MSRVLPAVFIALSVLLWAAFPPDFSTPPERVLVPDTGTKPQPARLLPALQTKPPTLQPVRVTAQMPAASYRYRKAIEIAAVRAFGLSAPVALLAAQVRAESAYRDGLSTAGAQGFAQFMPATAKLMAERYPELRPANPRNANWAFRAQALHMRDLIKLYPGAANNCEQTAFALSAYNGGPVALDHERAKANDPSRWFGQVEKARWRKPSAYAENRAYVRKILLVLEPQYSAAGWRGGLGCSA